MRRAVSALAGQLRAASARVTLTHYAGHVGLSRSVSSVFIAHDVEQAPYWLEAIFSTPPTIQGARVDRLSTILRGVALEPADIALVALTPSSESLARRNGWILVPAKVDCIVSLGLSVETWLTSIATKTLRADIAFVSRVGYSGRVLDPGQLRTFFETMLVPTVRGRHGARAHVSDLARLETLLNRGALLGVFRDGQWLAAALVHSDEAIPGRVRNAVLGWRGGDPALLKDRITTALYLEMLNWSISAGFQELDLGGCHPFVGDSLLAFKLKWGARVERARTPLLGLRCDLDSETARCLLARSPIIAVGKDGLYALGAATESPSRLSRALAAGRATGGAPTNSTDRKTLR
jgi:hypothetical protein